jgi:hypothetical protein
MTQDFEITLKHGVEFCASANFVQEPQIGAESAHQKSLQLTLSPNLLPKLPILKSRMIT